MWNGMVRKCFLEGLGSKELRGLGQAERGHWGVGGGRGHRGKGWAAGGAVGGKAGWVQRSRAADGQRRLMGEEMGSPAGSQRSNVTKNGTESSGIVMGVSDG